MNEHIWRQAERHQARRERNRLIRNGTITPAWGMKPQLMVKSPVDGSWLPYVGEAM